MRYSLTALIASVAVVGVPASGLAQSGCEREIKLPDPGAWAEYESTFEGQRTTLRYARLSKEADEGKAWIEMTVNTGKGADDAVIYQALVPGFPFRIEQVEELIFQAGKSDPTKAGPMMMRSLASGLQKSHGLKISELCEDVTLVDNERVTVQGGTFATRHYKNEQTQDKFDTWVSAETPFGLVKATGYRYKMELSRMGTDAKSSIKGTPKQLP